MVRSQLVELLRQLILARRVAGVRIASQAQEQTTEVLLYILGCAATPIAAFLMACRCLKALLSDDVAWPELVLELDALVAAFDRQASHPGLRALVKRQAYSAGKVAHGRELAAHWKIGRRSVSRVVARDVGIGLARLRIALRCRSAIIQLLATDTQIAQIAYGCGYQHPSQLDHDFDRLLGLSPRAFRNIASSCSRSSLRRPDQSVNKSVK